MAEIFTGPKMWVRASSLRTESRFAQLGNVPRGRGVRLSSREMGDDKFAEAVYREVRAWTNRASPVGPWPCRVAYLVRA